MKNKIILIFLGFITLLSCQQDDFYNKNQNSTQEKNDVKFQKISFSSLKTNSKALQKIKEVNSLKKNSYGVNYKTIYDEDYNVFIDTTRIIIIETENRHTITFKIASEDETDKEFENLILASKENGDYSAYIAKYILTDEESTLIKNGEYVNISPTTITSIESNYQTDSINTSGPCIYSDTTTEFICYPHSGGDPINYGNSYSGGCNGTMVYNTVQVLTIDFGCISGGGGSGIGGVGGINPVDGSYPGYGGINPGYGGNPGNGSGSFPFNPGNGNTNPNNPGNGNNNDTPIMDIDGNIITTPIINPYPKRNHIQELNKITDQNSDGTNEMRNRIDLYADNLDFPFEEGYQYQLNENGTYSEQPALNNIFNGVRFADVSQYFDALIRIHKHHNQLDPIFSFEDIFGMADFFHQKATKSPVFTDANNITSVMVSRTGVHALRVRDPQKVQDFYNYLLSGNYGGFKHFKNNYLKDVIEKTIKQCNGVCTPAQLDDVLVQNFIIFLNKLDSGLDYYFAPHPVNSNDNHVWIKQN